MGRNPGINDCPRFRGACPAPSSGRTEYGAAILGWKVVTVPNPPGITVADVQAGRFEIVSSELVWGMDAQVQTAVVILPTLSLRFFFSLLRLLDRAAPRTSLSAAGFDKFLEALEIATHPRRNHAEHIADVFHYAFRLVTNL